MKRVFFCLGVVLLGSLIAASSEIEGKIAFIREGNIWLANADGSNQRQLTKDGNFTCPSWSPDGQYIVCEREFKIGKSVWLIEVEKVSAKRLTPDDDYASDATFSSDGKHVIYSKPDPPHVSTDEFGGNDYLCAIDIQSKKETILAKEHSGSDSASFASLCSVDGIKDIIYVELTSDVGPASLFRFQSGIRRAWLKAKGEGEEDIIESYNYPAISHDRQYIAATRYVVDMKKEEESSELCLIRIADKDMHVFKLPPGYTHSPSFSPDGRCIVFVVEENVSDIWILDLENGNWRVLIENGDTPAWSPR